MDNDNLITVLTPFKVDIEVDKHGLLHKKHTEEIPEGECLLLEVFQVVIAILAAPNVVLLDDLLLLLEYFILNCDKAL